MCNPIVYSFDENIRNFTSVMYKAVVSFLILLILFGYLFISKPDSVVVNEKGKAEDFVNKCRAIIQGDRFWKYQLKLATEIL